MHYNLWGRMRKRIIIGSILIVSILVLVSISSAITANKVDKRKIEHLDNEEKEKITYIDGSCLGVDYNGPGFFRNVEIRKR